MRAVRRVHAGGVKGEGGGGGGEGGGGGGADDGGADEEASEASEGPDGPADRCALLARVGPRFWPLVC